MPKRRMPKKILIRKAAIAQKRRAAAKPRASAKRPVKVIFQCVHGKGYSVQLAKAFRRQLEKNGLGKVFKVTNVGMVPAKTDAPGKSKAALDGFQRITKSLWQHQLGGADIVISLHPKLLEIHEFKMPQGVKAIYVYGNKKVLLASQLNEQGKLTQKQIFEAVMKRAKNKFRLPKVRP